VHLKVTSRETTNDPTTDGEREATGDGEVDERIERVMNEEPMR